MLLSDFLGKTVYFNGVPRGVCLGVGVSRKTFTIKYLLCSDEKRQSALQNHTDFALPISALHSIGEQSLTVSRLRPAIPKNAVKLFLHRPVYTVEGFFLGNVKDVAFQNASAARLFTDQGQSYPFTAVSAVSDAFILRKSQTYPLGQRIPARLFSQKQSVVTKSVLRGAIEKNALIKLTLSLPPFNATPNTSQTVSVSPPTRR